MDVWFDIFLIRNCTFARRNHIAVSAQEKGGRRKLAMMGWTSVSVESGRDILQRLGRSWRQEAEGEGSFGQGHQYSGCYN